MLNAAEINYENWKTK